MKIPYHSLQVAGDVVFAAQGTGIASFDSTGKHISTWERPVQKSQANAEQTAASEQPEEEEAPEDLPPAKRRKVDLDEDKDGSSASRPAENSRKKSKANADTAKRNGEGRPFIQSLVATGDGKHLVALTGADKTIWVFAHDGTGNLALLSQRTMPKRPSSIALTLNEQTILSADKFGDVYSLPLIPSDRPASPSATESSTLVLPVHADVVKPQADATTVHTQRNLRALRDQLRHREQRQKELDDKKAAAAAQGGDAPTFEHTLLLGHVSMLTGVLAATAGGREYILTADRDEHIRVSRGIPQAYVIEGYCFGHNEFVSALCIPAAQPEVLVSGGGDGELFVSAWQEGRLLARADVLGQVQTIVPTATKIAVTELFAWQESQRQDTWLVALVERVPALFFYKLSADNTLEFVQTLPLPGNPLAVAHLGTGSSRLLLAVDPSKGATEGISDQTSSLRVLQQDSEAKWRVLDAPFTDLETEESDVTLDELIKILYSSEDMRKRDHDRGKETDEASSMAETE